VRRVGSWEQLSRPDGWERVAVCDPDEAVIEVLPGTEAGQRIWLRDQPEAVRNREVAV
jgi:hypothetical protein